jgi:hypothetical protein
MACDPRLVDEQQAPDVSAKRKVFIDLVQQLVAERRRALVFSQFVQLLTLLRVDLDEMGIEYEYLDGSTIDRDGVVQRFQQGTAPLFLLSLRAGGTGLTLTAADTVIHLDPWWNPAVETQATDRAHRIGQQRAVTVYRLVARGTIEDKIGELKRRKRELAEAIVGEDAGALAGLSEQDVLRLVGGVDEEVRTDDAIAFETPSPPKHPSEPRSEGGERVSGDALVQLAQDTRNWLGTSGKLQRELSALSGVPEGTLSKLLNGVLRSMASEHVARVRKVIG